jgi:hypothetical protein
MLIHLKPRPSGGRGFSFWTNLVDHLVRIVSAPARAFWTTGRGSEPTTGRIIAAIGWRGGNYTVPCLGLKLKRVALALKAMTITTSSVPADSSSGAFLRPPHRLRGHPRCRRWLTGITRTERPHTDMRQHGRRPCGHSLRAGTERRDRISYAVKPRPKVSGHFPSCGLRRVWPSAHNWQRHRASFVWRPNRSCPPPLRALPSHGRASALDHLDERMA